MQQSVLITGNSSGLGRGLSEEYLAQGWRVYGFSRRGCADLGGDVHDVRCDLNKPEEIVPALTQLLAGVTQLEVVYLNAGVFGTLKRLADISLEQLQRIMQINVWANKLILDYLLASDTGVKQVIAISSGAALSANEGWGAYCLSKIALNKLMELYANEYRLTHFTALAPGLVDTAMQDYLCDEANTGQDRFPGLEKFRRARGTAAMPLPRQAAKAIIARTGSLLDLPSGVYADTRNMD